MNKQTISNLVDCYECDSQTGISLERADGGARKSQNNWKEVRK